MKEKLKYILLIISILGVGFLFFLSFLIPPSKITTASKISINQRVIIQGEVIQERDYDSFSIIILKDNYGNITILSKINSSFFNKTVEVTGIIQEYNNILEISASKIRELN